VVDHQTPSKEIDSEAFSLLSHLMEILIPILVREEDVHSPNASLSDVMRNSEDNSVKGVACQLQSYSCKE